MLAVNATLFERLASLIPSKAPAPPPANDADRLLALGVPRVQDFRDAVRGPGHERGRPHGRRDVAKVGALGWHQSASGELDEGHPGLLSIPAHSLVHRSGAVTLLHDLTAYVFHGHAMNAFTIGIEIDCREPGLVDQPDTLPREDDRTFWRRKTERDRKLEDLVRPVTRQQVAAARALGRWYAAEIEMRGGRLIQCWTHRQARKSRRADPGERPYRLVVAPLNCELGLNDVAALAIGGGHPIPREWGAATNERYAA